MPCNYCILLRASGIMAEVIINSPFREQNYWILRFNLPIPVAVRSKG
jgi:hypothetical protein